MGGQFLPFCGICVIVSIVGMCVVAVFDFARESFCDRSIKGKMEYCEIYMAGSNITFDGGVLVVF